MPCFALLAVPDTTAAPLEPVDGDFSVGEPGRALPPPALPLECPAEDVGPEAVGGLAPPPVPTEIFVVVGFEIVVVDGFEIGSFGAGGGVMLRTGGGGVTALVGCVTGAVTEVTELTTFSTALVTAGIGAGRGDGGAGSAAAGGLTAGPVGGGGRAILTLATGVVAPTETVGVA